MDNPLVNAIYERRKENYKDIRHLYTVHAMEKRLSEIKCLKTKIPTEKRNMSNLKYKRLCIESRLITWKKCLYSDHTPAMAIFRMRLQLTDKRWGRCDGNAETLKRDHLLPLVHFDLSSKSDDELRQIIALIDEADGQ